MSPPTAAAMRERAFADALAHDLYAPLRAIENFAALLERRAGDGMDETSRDYLSRIRVASARMGALMASLSELSAAQRAEPDITAVDLSLLVEWVAAELADRDPKRRVVVTVQPGLQVTGDERLLRQLVQHLMHNAWAFTASVSNARIEVSANTDGTRQQLLVRDNGIGFDMRYAHKLFEPFQRLHVAEQGAGHGLGLAIAQAIAERHGGQLRGESVPGTGTVFTFEWPVAPATVT
ncbi:sensor histidine kinase [Aerolutibacter ruishenii]|uniref:histidine kinase n=1 Tax=Aerolutibacter ruishenii TaxID=686800 RepID=A0A562M0L3_9GAMM|nr:ATP-binding protein [Lysobacter ruishenii]TWI13459.1 hypothetical protein IP93_00621 [Lysobacter ruishenii]